MRSPLLPALLISLVAIIAALTVMVVWNSVPDVALTPAVVPIASY